MAGAGRGGTSRSGAVRNPLADDHDADWEAGLRQELGGMGSVTWGPAAAAAAIKIVRTYF